MLASAHQTTLQRTLTVCFAMVWLVNGLFCKLLHFVPRHQEIVGRILGYEHAALFTNLIGGSEVLMAVWVFSEIKGRWCTMVQVLLIATMNTIEFFLAPDLLLFGRANAIVASSFIMILLVIEFGVRTARSTTIVNTLNQHFDA